MFKIYPRSLGYILPVRNEEHWCFSKRDKNMKEGNPWRHYTMEARRLDFKLCLVLDHLLGSNQGNWVRGKSTGLWTWEHEKVVLFIYWTRNKGEWFGAGKTGRFCVYWVWCLFGTWTWKCPASSWKWRSGSKSTSGLGDRPWNIISCRELVFNSRDWVGFTEQDRRNGKTKSSVSRPFRNISLIPSVDFRISVALKAYVANNIYFILFYFWNILLFIYLSP